MISRSTGVSGQTGNQKEGTMGSFGMRRLAVLGCVFVLAGGGGVAFAQHARQAQPPGWVWYEGTDAAHVGQPAGSNTLVLQAVGDIDLRAYHTRMMSDDGEFVLAHPRRTPTASLNAYFLGSSTRTPIEISRPEPTDSPLRQNAASLPTSLIVAGTSGQRSDLQRWTLSGQTVAAIDGKGRLRLRTITLDLELVKGQVRLYALVGSHKQLIAQGAR
jgi:hypothetical protein